MEENLIGIGRGIGRGINLLKWKGNIEEDEERERGWVSKMVVCSSVGRELVRGMPVQR